MHRKTNLSASKIAEGIGSASYNTANPSRRQFLHSLAGTGAAALVASRPALPGMAAVAGVTTASPNEPPGTRRVYAHLLVPREHPDYTRRHVQPPSWDTFGGRTHLATLRDFEIQNAQIVGYVEKIEKYVHQNELGDVLWVSYPILMANNLGDLVREIKRQNLFLFDLWGYVPGSAGDYWQQFHPPAEAFRLFESELGERWLGMDNGEQDGRYIGGYASEFYPSSGTRLEQYFNFQRHFEELTDELGSKMATLVSLNFGHYFLKEGLYTLIGAETAQALPNGQVYYAFIRGAGKQYGVPWFGNASVWNRWGWKEYGAAPEDDHTAGPTHGTSLSLLKRLLYSHLLYNSVIVGFEGSFFNLERSTSDPTLRESDELSPIGKMQRALGRWIQEAGSPGVMLVPIAVMVDFFAGWTFPRHLYTNHIYRIWGNLPYEPGDYLTDGVLDMLYPGYQNSSYFHDESGFLTSTPYGDAADCILSDAPEWLLARYPVLVVAGGLEGDAEIRDKLEAYVNGGGHLLITAGSLAMIPGGLAGVKVEQGLRHFAAGKSVQLGKASVVEDSPFDLHVLAYPQSAQVLASVSGTPAAVEISQGKGRISIFASPFGLSASAVTGVGAILADESRNGVDKALAKPYPLLKHVRAILDQAFRSQMLFEAGQALSLITCRKGPGEYTLGVANHTWRQQPLKIISRCGRIESLDELTLDQSEKGAEGYLPEGLEKIPLGVSAEGQIAGGDLRIFAVRVREENVEEIVHAAPPARPRGRALPLRQASSIKEEVLSRPTFFQHFDSAVVDWRYLREREKEELQRESAWIRRQGLRLIIDLSSGINLYPDLRLVDNDKPVYLASLDIIDDVMGKMEVLSAQDLILSLHRYPENNFTEAQAWQSFETTLRLICERATRRRVTVHLRLGMGKPPENVKKGVEFVGRVGAANLRLAPSTAFLLASKPDQQETRMLQGGVGLWLVSTPQNDVAGEVWNCDAPIHGYSDSQDLAKILALAPSAPLVLDACYKNHDEEYLDAKMLQEMLDP